jgi:hypothetical protein
MARRLKIVTALTLVMVVFGASAALAGDCYVVKKPAGAGTHVTVTVDGEDVVMTGLTPSGRLKGGFVTVSENGEVFEDVMIVGIHAYFTPGAEHARAVAVPVGAYKSPDGKGIDTYHDGH